jgi:hypothetical protein
VAAPIFTQLEGRIPVHRHEHVAVLRRGREGAYRLASFLSEGLRAGDWCSYLAPAAFHAEMLERVRALKADVEPHLRQGSLRFSEGTADYRELREWTQQVFTDAEQAKAPAVRWLEDGIWPKPVGFPMPQFFEFHALLNYQVKIYPSVVICQYDIEQIEVHHLFCALAVHRHLLVENTLVRDNPFYIPAEKFIPLSSEERERDLLKVFRDVGFDVSKLLAAVIGFGRLQQPPSPDP